MNTFDTYLSKVKQFRLHHGIPQPTEQEINEWRNEWENWSQKRRVKEIESITSHLILSNVKYA